ncbi:MAG: glutaredoxin family protein [Dehalococcoidia bacterium]
MCRAARSFLDEKDVRYSDVNIARDGKAKYRVKKLTGRTRTPVFVIDGYLVTDFNPARIEALLADGGRSPCNAGE